MILESKLDVIVIDDNTESADLMAMIILLYGRTSAAYYDGLTALDAVRTLAPDIRLRCSQSHSRN
jgi:CheY-like chemotaxis protein